MAKENMEEKGDNATKALDAYDFALNGMFKFLKTTPKNTDENLRSIDQRLKIMKEMPLLLSNYQMIEKIKKGEPFDIKEQQAKDVPAENTIETLAIHGKEHKQ